MPLTNINNIKLGFVPFSGNPLAHGVYYINMSGQLNFRRFDVVNSTVYVGSGTVYEPQSVEFYAEVRIEEKHLIVGLMLDWNLFDAFKDGHIMTSTIKPIELYLMRATNINFVVPDNEYRLEHSPFVLDFEK